MASRSDYLATRRGRISYLGHLEFLRLIFRALRRAKIATNFTKGFNPTPKVSFGPALPVGTESDAEFFIMDLPEPLADRQETMQRLNDRLPPGVAVEVRVIANLVPGLCDRPHQSWPALGSSTDQKERGPDLISLQNFQQPLGPIRSWAIVDCQTDLF